MKNNSNNQNQLHVPGNNNDNSRNWNVYAVEQLKNSGGGFVYNEGENNSSKFVAPIPKK